MRISLKVQLHVPQIILDLVFGVGGQKALILDLSRQILKCLSNQFILLDELLSQLVLTLLVFFELFNHFFEETTDILRPLFLAITVRVKVALRLGLGQIYWCL